MRQSKLFTRTRKDAPSDEVSKNAQLLIRAGFISKEMAGVYALLPLGLKVVENIKEIIRDEMNEIGGQEMVMTTLQNPELWEKTDRWDDKKVDIWFKTKLQSGKDLGLAWSHEEPITDMMRNFISSYRDLPSYVYQFQTKLRNEVRAKSGIMRGREFLMKDLYSYSVDEESHQKFYEAATQAYHNVFDRLGIGDITFFTFASGGAFTQFSHEFQTLAETGEDTIYLDRNKKIAVNKEVLTDEVLNQLDLKRDDLEEVKASEVGNIFSFGSTKSEELDLYFTDEDGNKKPVILGSYGIGITRLVGVIAEIMSDEKGLIWPESIAPFQTHIVRIGDDVETVKQADDLYEKLSEKGAEVLYDDRNVRVGEMLADADLIGIPNRVIVSSKSIQAGGVEMKPRNSDKTKIISLQKFLEKH